jgi:hypothetical protein
MFRQVDHSKPQLSIIAQKERAKRQKYNNGT